MKGRAIIPLALGLCVGLVAVKFLVDTVKKSQGATSDRRMVTVFRAKQDLDAFQEITREIVDEIQTTENSLIPPQERFEKIEDLIGRVTVKSVPQQSAILKSMLAPPGTPAGMMGRIEPGFRAVSVKIDEATAVGYQIKPGDWVDVIVVMDVDSGSRGRGKRQTIAEVILQNIQVAAIGQTTTGPTATTSSAKVKPAKSATLIVREEDVPKLHLAGTRGKITLAMRGDDDRSRSAKRLFADSNVDFAFANQDEGEPMVPSTTERSGAPAPRQEMDVPHPVTVYHGSPAGSTTKVEQFMFANAHSRELINQTEGPRSGAASIFGKYRRPSNDAGAPSSGSPNEGDEGPADSEPLDSSEPGEESGHSQEIE